MSSEAQIAEAVTFSTAVHRPVRASEIEAA